MKCIKVLFSIIFLSANLVLAQDNLKIQKQTAAYILINHVQASNLFDVYKGEINLEYSDNIGAQRTLDLKFYDKTVLKGIYMLDKVVGTNHYSFNLADIGLSISEGVVYRCELVDENKTRWEWSVRCVKLPADNKPEPTIQVKPIQMACQSKTSSGSLIEYYGKVSGGRGPFTFNWYILNDARTEFLNQPREDHIEAKETSMIRLDHNPAYHVLLVVTDACGNTGKQLIRVSCSPQKKKINTVVVEPIDKLQSLPDLSGK